MVHQRKLQKKIETNVDYIGALKGEAAFHLIFADKASEWKHVQCQRYSKIASSVTSLGLRSHEPHYIYDVEDATPARGRTLDGGQA